jgi:hypothetical protein
MNEHAIRIEIHRILDSHDQVLAAVQSANGAMADAHTSMQRGFEAHDALLVSAIEANRAALRLLNRIMDEGIEK